MWNLSGSTYVSTTLSTDVSAYSFITFPQYGQVMLS
jgi:hypothetical protein